MAHDRASFQPGKGATGAESDTAWQARLGRLRIGAEPIEAQVQRYRRSTWVLTGVVLGIGLMVLSLFSGFGRPDLGGLLAGLLVVPTVFFAWRDQRRLERVAAEYRQSASGSA